MNLFGSLHLALLAATAILATLLTGLSRKISIRRALGALLAVNELIWWTYRYSREGVHAGNLPLQLCDAGVWLAVIAAFSDAPMLAALAWFPGLVGAVMALLTPNLIAPWLSYPSVYFFVAHGGIVITVCVIVVGGRKRFPPGVVWKSFLALLIYAAFVGVFDWLTGANYMFLLQKPEAATTLDVLGSWPWYLLNAAALALTMFFLLWLPVRLVPSAADRPDSIPGHP